MKKLKYDPLRDHLFARNSFRWVASLPDIEQIIGGRLPKSAYEYQAFWAEEANPHQPQKLAVRNAGWRVDKVQLERQVIEFARVGAATERTDHSPAIVGFEKETDMNVSVSFSWSPVGQLSLDENGALVFPSVPSQPGLYRFKIQTGDGHQVYVGESDNLSRRLQHYRTPGPSQATNIRLNALLRKALDEGQDVQIAVILEAAAISVAGQPRPIDLSKKPERVLLEHAALVSMTSANMLRLNR